MYWLRQITSEEGLRVHKSKPNEYDLQEEHSS